VLTGTPELWALARTITDRPNSLVPAFSFPLAWCGFIQSECLQRRGRDLSRVRIARWLGTLIRSESCGLETFQIWELIRIPLPQDKCFKHGGKSVIDDGSSQPFLVGKNTSPQKEGEGLRIVW